MGTKNKKPGNSRREFLKAAGKLTVYTPPAMMVLANPSLVAIAESGGRTVTYVPPTHVPPTYVPPTQIPPSFPETQSGGLSASDLCQRGDNKNAFC